MVTQTENSVMRLNFTFSSNSSSIKQHDDFDNGFKCFRKFKNLKSFWFQVDFGRRVYKIPGIIFSRDNKSDEYIHHL